MVKTRPYSDNKRGKQFVDVKVIATPFGVSAMLSGNSTLGMARHVAEYNKARDYYISQGYQIKNEK